MQQIIESISIVFATASLITSAYQWKVLNSLNDVYKHHEHLLNENAEKFQTDLELCYGDLLDRISDNSKSISDISTAIRLHELQLTNQQSSTSATKKELLLG